MKHSLFGIVWLLTSLLVQAEEPPISVLLLDGRNNHDWQTTSDALRAVLTHSGRFEVSTESAPDSLKPEAPRAPRTEDAEALATFEASFGEFNELTRPLGDLEREQFAAWRPDFASHDVVVVNYNGPDWSPEMRADFIDYVRGGGGVVLVHASNNPFRNWTEFNELIGLGWRPAPVGKALKVNPETGETFVDSVAGNSGHGSKHAFEIAVRAPEHPIMRGLPARWIHGKDELYHHMRGPAKNLEVLSSAFSSPDQGGTGQHEPITWEVGFGEGRVIVTTMGHFWKGQTEWDGLYCAGFQTVMARATEYAATGKVTLPVPSSFPTADETSISPPHLVWGIDADKAAAAARTTAAAKVAKNPYTTLTVAESQATFELADPGYRIESVTEPDALQEPVVTVWDGNGAMYVAEMRSYMQNVEGEGTKTLKNGRIKRLEDTDGDGIYEKVTIFVDGLNLPRAILPLDDRIAVRETDSTRVTAYRDTTGDGIADESTVLFEGKAIDASRSVEHQDSGLVWNLDNHIYISYNSERYRFTDGDWSAEKQPGHWTQWGLTHDDTGRLLWSANSEPIKAAHFAPRYWDNAKRRMTRSFSGDPIQMDAHYPPSFMQVKSLCLLSDRGGAASEVRGFTSVCGQSVFRGDRLPFEVRGDYFVVDPTIHVMRRSELSRNDGLLYLEKSEPGDAEFVRTADINSRFVNTASAPDGTLYITDMYRGIIQDAPWLSPGPREAIVEAGLDQHIQNGRVWRIRHLDHTPRRAPRMLDESTLELVRHLGDPNGWWRDTAQRLIILREDRDTVVPVLKSLARYAQNPLTRLHALRTLEGCNAIDPQWLSEVLSDPDESVRKAAIVISEWFPESDPMFAALQGLDDEPNGDVAMQLVLSLGQTDRPEATDLVQSVARGHASHRGVMAATTMALWGQEEASFVTGLETGESLTALPESDRATAKQQWALFFGNWSRGLDFPESMPDADQRIVKSGETLFFQHCIACHGTDGSGSRVPGTDLYLAPSLVDSSRVHGDPERLIAILLKGLVGPLDGKTYQAGFMAPVAALGITREDRLGDVASYLRYAWGGQETIITKEQVIAVKKKIDSQEAPWTQEALEAALPEG